MEKELIIKAVKSRLKYLDIIGGTGSCEVKTVGEMVLNISDSSDELMAFEKCKRESMDEFKRLSVELCADIMIMLSRSDDFANHKTVEIPHGFRLGGEFIPRKNETPINLPKSTSPMPSQMESLSLLNDVLSGKMPLYGQGGMIGDALPDPYSAFRNGHEHMIKVVQKLSNGDTACINGLADIIIKEERGGIVTEMLKIDLRGRAHCLGFMAKLCKCKIGNMDAIINAFKAGVLSAADIRVEVIERRGKRFSAAYIFDNYK